MSTQYTGARDKGVTTGGSGRDSNSRGSSDIAHGGGANRGIPYVLDQIEPDTLPEDPGSAWDEAARRYRAYKQDRDGWRTGSIETEIDEWGES